jgi:hypothetical protein
MADRQPVVPARDRDATGRPRNARPRDSLGRPLPRVGSEPAQAPLDDPPLPPAQAIAHADELLREARPFTAHEVLEAVWHVAPAEERRYWQGLAQIAVGLTHAQRGNAVGAVALLTRGADRIARHVGETYGVDVQLLVETCSQLADRIRREGLEAIRPGDFVLQLGARS